MFLGSSRFWECPYYVGLVVDLSHLVHFFFPSSFLLPFCPFPSLIYLLGVWSLAVVGTQHSGLREDNNNINSLFNYLFSSHAPTAV